MPDSAEGFLLDGSSLRRIARSMKLVERAPRNVLTSNPIYRAPPQPSRQRWQCGQNNFSSAAPAYSVGVLSAPGVTDAATILGGGAKGSPILTFDQYGDPDGPTQLGQPVFVFLGPESIAANGFGGVTQDWPAIASFDSSATPQLGDIWTVKKGQWSLTKATPTVAGASFVVLGQVDVVAQTMLVALSAGASGHVLAKLTGSSAILSPGNSDTFTVWSGDPGSESASGVTLTAEARFESCDKTGFAWLGNNGSGWYVVESEHLALFAFGTLATSLSAGGSCSCHVVASQDGVAPDSTLMISDKTGKFSGSSGAGFVAALDRATNSYSFLDVLSGGAGYSGAVTVMTDASLDLTGCSLSITSTTLTFSGGQLVSVT